MTENSVTISPKKASDESNAIYKWLLGIRKEVLVLVCQSICQEDNLSSERRQHLSSKHYRHEDYSNIQHIDNHWIYGFEMKDWKLCIHCRESDGYSFLVIHI